jgi:hypothetical protein
VLAAVAGVADENFIGFRQAILSLQLDGERAALVARLARYIHSPDVSTLLSAIARHVAPEVREAVTQTWRHRPDAVDPIVLEALTVDPVPVVRRSAAFAAVASERYDLLDRMTQDPEPETRREVAIAVGQAAPVGPAGLLVLEHLENDGDMRVRAAAHVARLLQGEPFSMPPGLDLAVAAEAVRDVADLGALRSLARSAPSDDRRLSAALALAIIQDDVAREVARSDPAPSVRHRVGGALELSMPPEPREPV